MIELWRTHLISMAALLNVVGLGMIAAFTATASADMKRPGSRFLGLTNNEVTWIASLPSITAVFGNLLSGYLSMTIGRKAVLIYASLPFVMSWLIIAYAPSLTWIYAGRLLAGFGSGLCSVAIPSYIIEITTTEVRGLLGSCFQVSYTIGVLMAMIFGIFIRWSWLAIIGAFFAIIALIVMYFMPESPSWLIAKGRNLEGIKSYQFLKGTDVDIPKEYLMATGQAITEPQKSLTHDEFRKPELYKPIALSIGLVFFQQFSGINALMSYTIEIFEHAESSVDPPIAASVVAGVQVIATVVGSSLMDKVGRTKLYITSGVFVTLGLAILGIYGIVSKEYGLASTVYGWVPLAGFIVFTASFSLGYGPIPYLMAPEFVPMHSRSAVLAVEGIFSSLFLFIVTKTFDDLRSFLSDYGVYWVYGFLSLLGCIFCWLCIPETRGKSVSEIQLSFQVNDEHIYEKTSLDDSSAKV